MDAEKPFVKRFAGLAEKEKALPKDSSSTMEIDVEAVFQTCPQWKHLIWMLYAPVWIRQGYH